MNSRIYKAIFFDLDGTLLPLDMDAFLERYFRLFEGFAQRHGLDPEKFTPALLAGVNQMLKGKGGINQDRFWETFVHMMGSTKADYWPITDAFYETDFNLINEGGEANPFAARIIATLKEKGYPLYLTTMPLFPRTAVEARLNWAALNPADFDRITTYENSTSVKPFLEYYQENVDAIGLAPEEILMVGNNTREDLAAMELGCDAYLVTDYLLDPIDFDVDSVKHGSLEDFFEFVQALPECGVN